MNINSTSNGNNSSRLSDTMATRTEQPGAWTDGGAPAVGVHRDADAAEAAAEAGGRPWRRQLDGPHVRISHASGA